MVILMLNKFRLKILNNESEMNIENIHYIIL